MQTSKRVTPDDVAAILAASTFTTQKLGDKTCVVLCKLPNGFEIIEHSSCVDPANYDEALGLELATKKIEGRVWMLEGYLLQHEISCRDRGPRSFESPLLEDCLVSPGVYANKRPDGKVEIRYQPTPADLQNAKCSFGARSGEDVAEQLKKAEQCIAGDREIPNDDGEYGNGGMDRYAVGVLEALRWLLGDSEQAVAPLDND